VSRLDVRQVATTIVVVVAAGVGVVYLAKALSQFDDAAKANSALSYDDREIAGGNSVLVDQEAAYEARVLIPQRSSYRVVTGPLLRHEKSLTREHVESWFRYFLMPRRPRGDARWIICYGCDPSELQGTYTARWQDRNGISIGRLK
jgi:hypothetical protein